MTKLTKLQKTTTTGGIGPMMLWVAMIGATMAVSTIMDVATTVAGSGSSSDANKTTSKGYSSSKGSRGYLRLSPFPARSAIMMGL